MANVEAKCCGMTKLPSENNSFLKMSQNRFLNTKSNAWRVAEGLTVLDVPRETEILANPKYDSLRILDDSEEKESSMTFARELQRANVVTPPVQQRPKFDVESPIYRDKGNGQDTVATAEVESAKERTDKLSTNQQKNGVEEPVHANLAASNYQQTIAEDGSDAAGFSQYHAEATKLLDPVFPLSNFCQESYEVFESNTGVEHMNPIESDAQTDQQSPEKQHGFLDSPKCNPMEGNTSLAAYFGSAGIDSNLREHLEVWQKQIQCIQSKASNFTTPTANPDTSEGLSSTEIRELPAPLRCMYQMISDLKDTQANILMIQESIHETQQLVNMIVNNPAKYFERFLQHNPASSYETQPFQFYNPLETLQMTPQLDAPIDVAELIGAKDIVDEQHSSPYRKSSLNLEKGLVPRAKRQFSTSLEGEALNEESWNIKRSRSCSVDVNEDSVMQDARHPRDHNSWAPFWYEGDKQSGKPFGSRRFGNEGARRKTFRGREAFDKRQADEAEDSVADGLFALHEGADDKISASISNTPLASNPSGSTRLARVNHEAPFQHGASSQLSRNEYQQLAASLDNPKGLCYAPSNNTWMAYGGNASGPRMCKSFPVHKYGFFEARNLAICALGYGKPKEKEDVSVKSEAFDIFLPAQDSSGEENTPFPSDRHTDGEQSVEASHDHMQLAECTSIQSNSIMENKRLGSVFYNAHVPSWSCRYLDADGSKKVKSFSIVKYGYEDAHKLAMKFMISASNQLKIKKSAIDKEVGMDLRNSSRKAFILDGESAPGAIPEQNSAEHVSRNQAKLISNSSDNYDWEKCSHVKGVNFNRQCNTWAAIWYANGVQQVKYFSVKQHGFDEAKRLAIQHRRRIDENKRKLQKERSTASRLRYTPASLDESSDSIYKPEEVIRDTDTTQDFYPQFTEEIKEFVAKIKAPAISSIPLEARVSLDSAHPKAAIEEQKFELTAPTQEPCCSIEAVGFRGNQKAADSNLLKRKSSHWKRELHMSAEGPSAQIKEGHKTDSSSEVSTTLVSPVFPSTESAA